MNSQQLTSFVQVAEKLSFSKAAEQLYLSVPTISRNIRLLEEELGVQLFVRDRHRVVLTEAGQCFYGDAKTLLRAEAQAIRHIEQLNRRALLRIGCTSHSEKRALAAALTVFRKKHPDAVPQLICDDYAKLLAMLRQQEIDVMCGSDNMARDEPGIRFVPFMSQDSVAVVPLSDPLSKGEDLSFADLDDRVLIEIPDRMVPFRSRNRIKDLLAVHAGHSLDIECEDEQSCLALASAGYGISILPGYKVPFDVTRCVRLPVRENEPYAYGALMPAEKSSPLAEAFTAILRDIIEKYLAGTLEPITFT